jgi:heptosyltransferase II
VGATDATLMRVNARMAKRFLLAQETLNIEPASVSRVIIRATNWVGDAVMSEPALSAVREAFPDAEVTWLARPGIAELFRGHPAIDRMVVYEHRGRHAGLSGKWTLASELRRHAFDLAILFQNAFEAAALALLAGVPRRYGYATDGRRLLLTHSVGVPERTSLRHQTSYYLDLLRPLGVVRPVEAPRLFVTAEEQDHMDRRLVESSLAPTDDFLGLNPGSTYGTAKRWLPERFARTADRLAVDFGLRVVILGAPGEEALGRSIADAMESKPIVLSGQTSMRELMAVIKRCRLLVTNDTGPMHIAAAFGVPVVAVFGPTDWRTTAPFGDLHRIVRQPVDCSPCLLRECPIDHRCMNGVSVDDVYKTAADRLCNAADLPAAVDEEPLPDSSDGVVDRTEPGRLQGVTIFLDRDGTVNRDTGYIKSTEELELLPGVVDGVACLNRAGATVVLVTNQSGVARGILSVATLTSIHAALNAALASGGARLDAIYYCPHHPDEHCLCRKPETGMVTRAAKDLGVDPSSSYVIGDKPRDIELARRIGARSILVLSGSTSVEGLQHLQRDGGAPDAVAAGFREAVEWILRDVERHES